MRKKGHNRAQTPRRFTALLVCIPAYEVLFLACSQSGLISNMSTCLSPSLPTTSTSVKHHPMPNILRKVNDIMALPGPNPTSMALYPVPGASDDVVPSGNGEIGRQHYGCPSYRPGRLVSHTGGNMHSCYRQRDTRQHRTLQHHGLQHAIRSNMHRLAILFEGFLYHASPI